ncbi:hypothetical protein [Cellulophaga omnivescoria]|uniref:hypothetical protein n=1 Tax=Cellulophaga omnivescoria TaxID=1888890 RepID=UPI000987C6CC|nr:hypothetical protein [Cellulophaga omnivescoria]WBU89373.1 hypothetical protein PBN93_16060 [Cellulophaga omnivescoria]WKB81397.1 hypothetical protein QYR09_16805 [Cellulophaga lytica]
MKKVITLVMSLCLVVALHANTTPLNSEIKVGTELKIGAASSGTYQHLVLPRKNFIIKRGGLANYKSLKNLNVVVTAVTTNKNGDVEVTLKRKNSKKFFNSHPTIKANYTKAIAEEELIK